MVGRQGLRRLIGLEGKVRMRDEEQKEITNGVSNPSFLCSYWFWL